MIKQLKSNWILIQDIDIKDENNWLLFVKEKSLIKEDVLIRFLGFKFGFKQKKIFACSEYTIGKSKNKITTLWIKKDAIKKFTDKFDFHLPSKDPYIELRFDS